MKFEDAFRPISARELQVTRFPDEVRAGDLIESGECSPQCLLASEAACQCRCGGSWHGALIDVMAHAMDVHTDLVACQVCGRGIAERTQSYMFDMSVPVCTRCGFSDTRPVHQALLAADCHVAWHDMWDHSSRWVHVTAEQRAALLAENERVW